MRQLLTPATVTLNTSTSSTAAFNTSIPSERPTPATVSWDSHSRPGHPSRSRSPGPRSVARVLDQWRYDGHWWEGEISREYYLVELVDGVRLELFQEGDAWWLAKTSD